MTKVIQRKLSYGEELENERKAKNRAGKASNTFTFSIRIGDLHYTLHQSAKVFTKALK